MGGKDSESERGESGNDWKNQFHKHHRLKSRANRTTGNAGLKRATNSGNFGNLPRLYPLSVTETTGFVKRLEGGKVPSFPTGNLWYWRLWYWEVRKVPFRTDGHPVRISWNGLEFQEQWEMEPKGQ